MFSKENDILQIDTEKKLKFCSSDYAFEDYIALLLFIILLVVVFLQLFTRYIINTSISWTEEIARYLLITIVFIGSPMGVRKRTHCSMEFLYRRLHPRAGRIVYIAVDVINTVFFGIGVYLSIRILPIMKKQYMAAIPYPLTCLYVPVMIGFIMMTIQSVRITLKHVKTGFVPDSGNPDNLPQDKNPR